MPYLPRMTAFDELASLLRRRVEIIGDLEWRDRDAAGHLAALGHISEEISQWANEHKAGIDGQLRHFLANASYQKALAHVEAQIAAKSGI